MATASSTETLYYEIDPAGDFEIKVIEYDLFSDDGNGNNLILKQASFKVAQQKILNHVGSGQLKAMLGGKFLEGSSKVATLHEGTVASVELWLRVFHSALNDEMYHLPVPEIWNAIDFGRKYLLHNELLNTWYKTYWSRLNKNDLDVEGLQTLLFPSQNFDHIVAFAYISKALAHVGVGHIQEINPSRFRDLHVEGRVVQQLNAARGSMRTEIIKGLFNPLDPHRRVCSRECAVHEKSIKAYIDSISKTGVWPLEYLHKKSNQDVVESSGFKNWTCNVPEGACMSCRATLSGSHIQKTYKVIAEYWQGLCLDCMDISKSKTGSLNNDYWLHNELKMYDKGCRMRHDRNTWYFSFMGRAEAMDAFKLIQKQRRQERLAREALGSNFNDSD